MNKNLIKTFTVLGTRPDVIKLFPVIKCLDQDDLFNNIVVSTSQHKEMIEDLLIFFSIDIDENLNIFKPNQSLFDITIRALEGLDCLMEGYHPDLVIVQGDTTTAFIGALAAFYHKIPVAHVEAGPRSFDKQQPYPEEINRKLISTICDLHFAPTHGDADNLKSENIDPERIFITGNTVIDTFIHVTDLKRNTLSAFLPSEALNSDRLILVTGHRRENLGEPLENVCYAIRDIVRCYRNVHVVYPIHLNPNVQKTVRKILDNQNRIYLIDPLPYEPFVEAMAKSYFILTDSGGVQEEGSFLGKPVLVFRDVTERHEGVEAGSIKLVGTKRQMVFWEMSSLLEDKTIYSAMSSAKTFYGDGHAAERIIEAIRYYFNVGELK